VVAEEADDAVDVVHGGGPSTARGVDQTIGRSSTSATARLDLGPRSFAGRYARREYQIDARM
jgi:hypothetical protein